MFYWRPLHFAADAGRLEIVKILVAKGVAVNELTSANTTARYWASINRHRLVEKYLVDHGALDPDREYEMIMRKLDLGM